MKKGLYIHIPFCKKRCSYCSFTISGRGIDLEERYIQRLNKEIEQYKNEDIDSIYIGGGTPSILKRESIQLLSSKLNSTFNLNNLREFTFECNPDDVTKDLLIQLKAIGVNRISLGVQTFNSEILESINRSHNHLQAIKALELISDFFDNYSIDLIIGLPNSNKEIVLNDIKIALKYGVKHISIYSLIVEEGTKVFHDVKNKKIELLDDDRQADIYSYVKDYLEKFDIYRYEISNFSLKGYESYHNLKYWSMDDYIGVGISAHSLLRNVRYYTTSKLSEYLNSDNNLIKKTEEILKMEDYIFETIMLGLRTDNGVNLEKLKINHNYDFFTEKKDFYNKYKNMFNYDGRYLSLKKEYTYILNTLLVEL